MPMVGHIAKHNKTDEVVVEAGSKSSIAEMFRLLRTNLQYLHSTEDTSTFLITSVASGEGKTFVAANLGMAMALANKRTVVLGMDLRKPALSKYFNGKDELKGISAYIVGQQEIEDIIHRSGKHEKLDYIPSGPIPPNPSELMLHERVDHLFKYLKRKLRPDYH